MQVALSVTGTKSIQMSDPCKNCGICCQHFRISFYQGELKSMGGWVPDELTVQLTGTFAAMKETEKGFRPCAALKEGRCSIYAQRPMPCRDFPAVIDGKPNPECLRLKELYNV